MDIRIWVMAVLSLFAAAASSGMALAVCDTPPSIDQISISPASPEVWDDITCSVDVTDADGDLGEARFRWFRNTILVRTVYRSISGTSGTEHDVLGSSLTKEGDQIRCLADAFDATGRSDSRDITVRVQETAHNNPPVIQGIPRQTVMIGDAVDIDMWDYSHDVEDSGSELDFSLTSSGNPNIIECYITADRYVACGEAKQLGETSLTVRVTDTGGAWDTDTFVIEVSGDCPFCQDDEPVIESIDIDPDPPVNHDDVSCRVHAEDTDGDLDSADFRWFVDGSLVRSRTRNLIGYSDTASDALPSYHTSEGDSIECIVSVQDSSGLEDHATAVTRVEDGTGTCRIDVYDLEVEDSEDITFRIRNQGDDTTVNYRIFVDDDEVRESDIFMDDDSTRRVSYRFGFDDHEGERVNIRVRAEAVCGDADEEDIDYRVPGDCRIDVYDLEVEDNEDITFRIRNRGDFDTRVDYRILVDGHEEEEDDIAIDEDDSERIRFEFDDFEDGETYSIDVRAEARCGDTDRADITYVGGHECSGRYLERYRCSGNWVQRLYRETGCNVEWRDWQFCSLGCSGNSCTGQTTPATPSEKPAGSGCGLVVDAFTLPGSITTGSPSHVTAVIRNSGTTTKDAYLDVFLNGVYLGRKSFVLSPGASTTKVWNYIVPGDTHTVSIAVSSAGCSTAIRMEKASGSGASAGTVACNYNQVCEAGESWSSCPYDCEKPGPSPGPTAVDVTPRSMDVNLYKSKVISLRIDSFVKQDFRISVSGVPQDWLSYKPVVSAEGEKTAYVFVNPKEKGSYIINVKAEAVREGLTFTDDVRVFVAQEEKPPVSGDGLTGLVVGFFTNIYTIIVLIIITAAVLAWYSITYLREENKTRFE